MVAIKDFCMPSCCENCNMYDPSESDYCSITGSWVTGFEGTRLDDCPLVEIEERKGRWIEHNQTTVDGSRDYIECSCCKVWFGKWKMPRNSYCPNCGAEMESKE